jgi:hypothetical protein
MTISSLLIKMCLLWLVRLNSNSFSWARSERKKLHGYYLKFFQFLVFLRIDYPNGIYTPVQYILICRILWVNADKKSLPFFIPYFEFSSKELDKNGGR